MKRKKITKKEFKVILQIAKEMNEEPDKFDNEYKEDIIKKLKQYLKQMELEK